MALHCWIGNRWRRVSKGEARFRRASGYEVVEGDAPPPDKEHRVVVAPEPVVDLEKALPPIEMPGVSPVELADRIAAAESKVVRKCGNCGEPGHTKAKCPLFDDAELERLTAPEAQP